MPWPVQRRRLRTHAAYPTDAWLALIQRCSFYESQMPLTFQVPHAVPTLSTALFPARTQNYYDADCRLTTDVIGTKYACRASIVASGLLGSEYICWLHFSVTPEIRLSKSRLSKDNFLSGVNRSDYFFNRALFVF